MKLYTEEQGTTIDLAKINVSKNRILESLTPIEIPSDEEIENHIEDDFLNANRVQEEIQLLMKEM
jgi:hypothetical protein